MTRTAYIDAVRAFLPLLLLAACATRKPAQLEVSPRPLPEPSPIPWRTDADAALEEARLQRKRVFLYFHSEWNQQPGYDHYLELPQLAFVWEQFRPIRVNVDLRANGDICRTWRPGYANPSVVLLGPDRGVLDRWEDRLQVDEIAERARAAIGTSGIPAEYEERWNQATNRLAGNKIESLRQLVAVLESDGHGRAAYRLALMECREHFYRFRWTLCVDACEQVLRRWPGSQEAIDLRARALFRGSGIIEPVTQARIERGESLSVGEPAVDFELREVLEGNAYDSETSAWVVGLIRDSRVLPTLIDRFRDKSLRVEVRARIAKAMDYWCEPAFLPTLIAALDDRTEAASVRIACAWAVAHLGAAHGGLYGSTVVEPIFRALDTRNRELREACIEALATVRDDYDLARLFDAMEKSDRAVRVFTTRAGILLNVSRGPPLVDEFPPGTDLFLRDWWDANAGRLRWDATHRRYVMPGIAAEPVSEPETSDTTSRSEATDAEGDGA
ncbi:MAG: hypothetical protein AAGD14_07750 [Planctomycetota bacterium]